MPPQVLLVAQVLSECGTLPETLPQQCSRDYRKLRVRSVHVGVAYCSMKQGGCQGQVAECARATRAVQA